MRKECRNCGALERADGSCDCVSVYGGVVRFGRPKLETPETVVILDGQRWSMAELAARLGLQTRHVKLETK